VLSIEISSAAADRLLGLPSKQADQIDARIRRLASQPFPPGCIKLAGTLDVFRVRQGTYRILYRVRRAENILVIEAVGDRKDIYR